MRSAKNVIVFQGQAHLSTEKPEAGHVSATNAHESEVFDFEWICFDRLIYLLQAKRFEEVMVP